MRIKYIHWLVEENTELEKFRLHISAIMDGKPTENYKLEKVASYSTRPKQFYVDVDIKFLNA